MNSSLKIGKWDNFAGNLKLKSEKSGIGTQMLRADFMNEQSYPMFRFSRNDTTYDTHIFRGRRYQGGIWSKYTLSELKMLRHKK